MGSVLAVSKEDVYIGWVILYLPPPESLAGPFRFAISATLTASFRRQRGAECAQDLGVAGFDFSSQLRVLYDFLVVLVCHPRDGFGFRPETI